MWATRQYIIAKTVPSSATERLRRRENKYAENITTYRCSNRLFMNLICDYRSKHAINHTKGTGGEMFYYLSARPVIRNVKIFAQNKYAVGMRRSGMNMSTCCRMPFRSHGFIKLTVRLILSYCSCEKIIKKQGCKSVLFIVCNLCYVQLNINFQ